MIIRAVILAVNYVVTSAIYNTLYEVFINMMLDFRNLKYFVGVLIRI